MCLMAERQEQAECIELKHKFIYEALYVLFAKSILYYHI